MTRDVLAGLSPEARAALLARARQVRTAAVAADRIPTVPRTGPLPLSHAQQRLWILDQLNPGRPTYKTPWTLRLLGALDLDVLRRALDRVVARHEMLRSRYPHTEGIPYVVIDPPGPVAVEIVDLTGEPGSTRDDRMREEVLARTRRPVDLARGPVCSATAVRMGAEDHVLVLDIHHIVTDGWSLGILTRDLLTYYQVERAGAPDPLPPLAVQYVDYAAWQRTQLARESFGARLRYWTDRLAGLSTLDLPADRPRPAAPTGAGAGYVTTIAPDLHRAAEALARSAGVRLHTVLHAAFCALLHHYTGSDDIVAGCSFSGRTRSELEPIVGCFVNTLVLRVRTDGDPPFRELLARAENAILGAHDHQDVPFDRVVDAMRPERDARRPPLFSLSFGFQDLPPDSTEIEGVRLEPVPFTLGTSRFDASMGVGRKQGGELVMGVEYSTELFDTSRIERLTRHYARLLASALADPDRRLSELELLEDADRAMVLAQPEPTDPAPSTVVDGFTAWAARVPERTAVVAPDGTLTYGELDRASAALAHRLRARGVGPEVWVGLSAVRSTEYAVGLLGILRAGGAVVPVEPEQPEVRQATVLATAGATIHIGRDALGAGPVEAAGPLPAIDPATLAYAVFTSGSTGQPKGVAVEHRSVAAYLTGIAPSLHGPRSYAICSTLAADLCLTVVFGALTTGAELHLVDKTTATDPAALAARMRAHPVDMLQLVPAHIDALLATADPADALDLLPRRVLMLGGEPLTWELVGRIRALRPDLHIVNHYGPTETTIGAVANDIPFDGGDGSATVPLGRPLPHVLVRIVDPHGRPVPIGIAGEVFIGGVGVARGYLGAPAQTAARFGPDPTGTSPLRCYRAGDRARWRADGTLEFLSRLDDQVMINGFRVEPGEATAALHTFSGVRAAAVTARADGGTTRLVAYVVPVDASVTVDALRAHLTGLLPAHLVPSAFVLLDEMPLTANGKVDRRALPAPDGSRPELAAEYVAPRSEVEEAIAQWCAELLAVDRVGVRDNFFTLGGNSLQAMRLVSRVRSVYPTGLTLRTFFGTPTVAAAAAQVSTGTGLTEEETLALLSTVEGLTDDDVRAQLAQA